VRAAKRPHRAAASPLRAHAPAAAPPGALVATPLQPLVGAPRAAAATPPAVPTVDRPRARRGVGGGRRRARGPLSNSQSAVAAAPVAAAAMGALRSGGRRNWRRPQQNVILFGWLLPNRRPTEAILFQHCSALSSESHGRVRNGRVRPGKHAGIP